ncbi:hypothetical protein FGO68_gene13328 [Halteria grandinella]|uniref:Uncharacterized protein n=1 Tax=Halteria grandinella TaxID=5974 RepID=A0A8J8NHI4_HALGN|nr:hypothetical protein FGO68_gene13328 [Halteria grandinella]
MQWTLQETGTLENLSLMQEMKARYFHLQLMLIYGSQPFQEYRHLSRACMHEKLVIFAIFRYNASQSR